MSSLPVFTSLETRSTLIVPGPNTNTIVLYRANVEDPLGVVFIFKPLMGDDAALFNINDGIVTLNTAITTASLPSDANNDNIYEFTITATNSVGSTDRLVNIQLFLPYIPEEVGFVRGEYYIVYVNDDYKLEISERFPNNSKCIQENLLPIIRKMIMASIETDFDYPDDIPETRPYVFYDPTNPSLVTAQTLKDYLTPGYTMYTSQINKVVDQIYGLGKSFVQTFFTPSSIGFETRLKINAVSGLLLVANIASP